MYAVQVDYTLFKSIKTSHFLKPNFSFHGFCVDYLFTNTYWLKLPRPLRALLNFQKEYQIFHNKPALYPIGMAKVVNNQTIFYYSTEVISAIYFY